MYRSYWLKFSFLVVLLSTRIDPIESFFSSSSWNESGHVITLNNENFRTTTEEYDVLLVMFYVRWCSHCQRLHPDYEKAGEQLAQDTDLPIHIAKFDCTRDRETQCGRRYGIHGYPALRIYRHGRFTGEELNSRNRTTDELVKTMKKFNQHHHHDHGIKLHACSKCRRIQDQPSSSNRTPSTLISNRWLVFLCIGIFWIFTSMKLSQK